MTPGNLIQAVTVQTTVASAGRQVPIPFELPFDPSRIVAGHTYGIHAAIKSGGRMLFASDTPIPVITEGQPTDVHLWVKGVAAESNSGSGGLVGTVLRLEDLAGAGVLDRVEATLEFLDAGKVAESGSCNRFFGTVEITGAALEFGQIGSTKMACIPEVGNQEDKYLKALQGAERYTLEGTTLLVYSKATDKPLRFVRKDR